MLRIVELTELSGAYATRLFAEQGHEVIRVEQPEGDNLRRLPPFLGDKPRLEHSAYHQFLNAGKKSLTLNLRSSSGQKILLELVRKVDVLVTNPHPLLEEKVLFETNPSLVLARIQDEGAELCVFARSGLMSLTGHPDKSPMVLGGHLAYLAAGTYVAVAIASAVAVFKKTGKGMTATVSIREALESLAEQAMVEYGFSGVATERRGSKGAITAISGALPCRDGYWVISQIHRAGRWSKFMDWVQDPELASDPSLAEEENQYKKRDFIMDRLHAWAKRFPKTQLVEEAQNRHFPASPVSTPLDLVHDQQLIARGFLAEMDHPEFGRITFPQGAIAAIRGIRLTPAPTLGQHNLALLTELGYSEADTQTLIASGAI